MSINSEVGKISMVEIWEKTMNLRFIERFSTDNFFGETFSWTHLQQQSVNCMTGEVKWEDVPTHISTEGN